MKRCGTSLTLISVLWELTLIKDNWKFYSAMLSLKRMAWVKATLLFSLSHSWCHKPTFQHSLVRQRIPRQLRRKQMTSQENDTELDAKISVLAFSGLTDGEFGAITKAIEAATIEGIGISIPCGTKNIAFQQEQPCYSTSIIGALGRVIMLETNLNDESIEIIQYAITEQLDILQYSDPPILCQPVLVSLKNPKLADQSFTNLDDSSAKEALLLLLEDEVRQHELNKPLNAKRSRGRRDWCPTFHVELDGAEVIDSQSSATWWDTSTVLVIDDLIDERLRRKLLDLLLGTSNSEWDDKIDGPDPKRWIRGGLNDIPTDKERDDEAHEGSCWGLPDAAIDELCSQKHDAIEEFEEVLSEMFPHFVVSRLPVAVFGESISPLTANAPTYGDHFDYHIDGDPNLAPPSPWTDVYGRYPNRKRGKPRFVSCLVYLNDEWEAKHWGATTKFLDLPTNESLEVAPKPGRCVFMDQDITHSVTAPSLGAGKRPRYSLVWKLILHPRSPDQDMTLYTNETKDGVKADFKPVLFGSAERDQQLREAQNYKSAL